MSFNIKAHKDDFLFIPLGGCNEIGINVNLYHYKGKYLIVDCGSGFADDYLPGVDMLVADMSFIAKYKKDIVGLVLTHAHEDHLGGIQYLWNELECPIYATTFTANFLKIKLSEYGLTKKVKMHEIKPGGTINLEPFSIDMVPLTHSAPEMQALVIKTDKGNIFHTGDWKFDHDPLVGEAADQSLIKKYGDEGILALVCDSTNVFSNGSSGSEGDLRESLVKIIAGCKKMIVATTFASNLARLDTLIHCGVAAGRKIVLSGRSMHRMLAAAQSSGYLQNIPGILDERDVANHRREDLLIIATGCQGEPMASTSKMAEGTHQNIKLARGDTVIFSSKIIPGNESNIYRMFNTFVRVGVEVITERDHFVHVSGHPAVDELKTMYDLVRPKISIPVHGEPIHLHEHAKLAKAWGAPHAIEVQNGSVVLLDAEGPKVIGMVENGYSGVEGGYLLPIDSPIFRMRRRIRDAGVVVATIIIGRDGRLLTKPILSAPGCLDTEDDAELIRDIIEELNEALNHATGAKSKNVDLDKLAKSALKRIIKTEIGKTPMIIVNVEKV
jgi:ribonuclease J